MVIKGGAVMNMVAFGKKVVKFRIPILIISILLLIPAGLGEFAVSDGADIVVSTL